MWSAYYKIEYGAGKTWRDVTMECLETFVQDGHLSLPGNDMYRRRVLGDTPCPGVPKSFRVGSTIVLPQETYERKADNLPWLQAWSFVKVQRQELGLNSLVLEDCVPPVLFKLYVPADAIVIQFEPAYASMLAACLRNPRSQLVVLDSEAAKPWKADYQVVALRSTKLTLEAIRRQLGIGVAIVNAKGMASVAATTATFLKGLNRVLQCVPQSLVLGLNAAFEGQGYVCVYSKPQRLEYVNQVWIRKDVLNQGLQQPK
jgi:hypothetical protein